MSVVEPFFKLGSFVVCIALLIITGCVTQSSIENSDQILIEEAKVDIDGPNSNQKDSPVLTPSRAVQNMIDESNRLLADGKWESAIAMAERGIRIDRRVPELYLALAKGYEGLNDIARAQQFAKQGLRYIDESDTGVIASLRRFEGLNTR